MIMDAASKKTLKAKAHALKPVVMIGQAGLTAAVLAEIEIALNCHELIKVKIRAEKDERNVIGEEICKTTHAELIQMIGQILVIFRKIRKTLPKAKPKFKPNTKKPIRHKPRK
jgi:RNA-binding protein